MVGVTGRAPLVGREHELTVLTGYLAAAATGDGGVALVCGEPGIGKTRLLAELAARARAMGATVLSGRAYDTEGMPPFVPFVEALRAQVRASSPERLAAQLGRGAADIARLLPELRELLPHLPVSPSLGPDQDRYRLFEAVCDALEAIARGGETGLLLTLDDLHWADAPTLYLLQHLAGRLAGAPILLIVAYRTVDTDPSHGFADTLATLAREGARTPLVLTPLGARETAMLVETIAGGPVAAAVAADIQRATEGNPFFIGEVVRDLLARGRVLTRPDAASGEFVVPELVRQVIAARLGRLRPVTTTLLRGGAVLGDGFTLEVARTASGLETEPALDALDEALAAGMLRAEGEAYHFAHALIRRTVYDSLSPPRRPRLHLRAAEAIEAVHGLHLDRHLAALAAHYRLAGSAADPEKAIEYTVRAGEAAQAVFAWEEAIHHWQAALEVMEAGGEALERRATLLQRMGNFMFLLGFDWYARAVECFEQALPLFEAVGDAEQVAEMHLAQIRIFSSHPSADYPRGSRHIQAAEAILARGPERAALAALYSGLAGFAFGELRTTEGLAAIRKALAINERVGDPTQWSSIPWRLAILQFAQGEIGTAFATLEESWEFADRINDSLGGYLASSWRGLNTFWLGAPREARDWWARELGKPRLTPNRRQGLLANVGVACADAGELGEAARLQEELGTVAYDMMAVNYLPPQLAFRRGAWGEAQALWTAAQDRHRRAGNRVVEAEYAIWLGQVLQVADKHAQAETVLRDALALVVAGLNLPLELHLRARLVLLAADAGQARDAEPHLSRGREILSNGEDWRGLAGRVALAEAVTAAARGQAVEADRGFARAIAAFRQHTLPWDEAEALTYWGRALLAAGRREDGATRLAAADDLYQRHAAGEAWRTRLSSLPPLPLSVGTSVPIYPDGLSEREVEVLRLIAAAKSNPEIAAALVISLNTVYHHVSHIFQKTGAANRVEAATYAQRHGLV